MASNYYSNRRSNPGKPPICKIPPGKWKPKPPPICVCHPSAYLSLLDYNLHLRVAASKSDPSAICTLTFDIKMYPEIPGYPHEGATTCGEDTDRALGIPTPGTTYTILLTCFHGYQLACQNWVEITIPVP